MFKCDLVATSIEGTATNVGVTHRHFWDADLLVILDNRGQEIAARCEWGGVTMKRTVPNQRGHKVDDQRSVSLSQAFSIVIVAAMHSAA